MAAFEPISWSFGLRNHNGLYLTSETFGFAVNCTGKIMKKKQILFLETQGSDVFIKTNLGRYLTFKEDGKFLADATTKGKEEAITIEAQKDGRWALKTFRGYYAGGTGESLDAYTKEIKADRLWTVQLAMHPQVAIKNVNRKRYVHLSGDKLTTDEDIPWGRDALINLAFFEEGKYGLETDDGRWLSETSELKAKVDESCKFTLEFFQQQVAFRSSSNKYLTGVGATGVLKATKEGPPTVDEFFVLEDSQPQFKLKHKGQFASVKVGLAVTFNQAVFSDTETFQFEINPATKQWSLKTNKSKYWSLQADGTIHAIGDGRSANDFYTVSWIPATGPTAELGPKIALKAANGNYISVKKNGQTVASGSVLNEDNQFAYEIINRPRLVLRGEHGFIGTLPSGNLECNKSAAEAFDLHISGGHCKISSASTGKFWKVGVTGISATGAEPDLFSFLYVELSKLAILAPNGKYLQGQQNGSFTATGTAIDASTLFEY